MTFEEALTVLKDGEKIARFNWNGKGMFLKSIDGRNWNCWDEELDGFEKLPFIVMKTADEKIVPWLASQSDVLADDWVAVL